MRLRDCLIDGDEPFAESIILYPWRCWYLWSSPLYDARTYLLKWIEDAKDTGIKELLKLVDLVESHMKGILNWYESWINNGVMEGFNSVLQAFKGRARGYRSFERYRTMIYREAPGCAKVYLYPKRGAERRVIEPLSSFAND